MAVNQKLTNVIKGRVVQDFQSSASEVLIGFADGSAMKIKIAGSINPQLPKGARIRQVSEHQAKLVIGCEDDNTIELTLADPGSSVAVRDQANQVEYLG